MQKKNVLTNRQIKILKIIIQNYIEVPHPISSKFIYDKMENKVSTATIRNECIELEEAGYLEKIHKSSGRSPSSKGYRYYVDNLLEKTPIKDLKIKINEIFNKRNQSIKNVLDQVGLILSEFTHLTTIWYNENDSAAFLKTIQSIELNEDEILIIFVLSNGNVLNKTFNFNKDIDKNDFHKLIEIFKNRLIGTNIEDISDKIISLSPLIENKIKNYENILMEFTQTIINLLTIKKNMHGVEYMLENPEYNDANKVKKIIHFIENTSPFDYLNKNDPNQKIVTKIGNEVKVDDIEDLALISSSYKIKGKSKGSLTLVGPKRIEYNKIHNILNWLIEKINKEFSSG